MSTSETRVWRTDVEGLRGIAVLLVVCFHAGLPALRGAFVAVDVFFVLSGFFLTTTLTRLLVTGDQLELTAVYARRVWRLLPGMVVVVLATLVMAMWLYAPIDRAAVADHMGPVSMFASNLAFAANGVNYFSAGENPMLHTWTLGVELQLALILPALVAVFAAIGRRRAGEETGQARRLIVMRTVFVGIAIVGALSFAVSVWISGTSPMWAYFGPHTRLWSFCAGSALAFIAGGGQSMFSSSLRGITVVQVLGLAGVFLPVMFYDRSMAYPGAIAIAPVGGTLLLLSSGALGSETLPGRVLSSRPLVALGRVSFAWYLWHWPLMVLGGVLVPGLGAWGRFGWGLAGLAFAVVTQRVIEGAVSARVMPRVMSSRPLLYAAGVSVALLLVAQMSSMGSNRYVANSVHRTFAAAREDRMQHNCWVDWQRKADREECAFGDVGSSTKIALLGDSHAEHWLGGLERAGKENGWRIEAHVMGGCPVSDFGDLVKGGTAKRYRECSRYRGGMLRHLVAQKPRAVILSSSDYYFKNVGGMRGDFQVSEAAWTEGLRRTYSRLSGAGIQVIALRGTPWVPFNVPSCLSRRAAHLLFATDCTYAPDREFIERARRAQETAARGLNVRFVDMNDRVCSSARCETVRGGIVMFTDDNHLTASMTRSLGAVLGERIAAIMPSGPAAGRKLLEKPLFQLNSRH